MRQVIFHVTCCMLHVTMLHKPVLLKEVIEILNPQSGENFIDTTIGDGGHAQEIIEKIKPNGKLIGIDWDREQINKLKIKFSEYLKSDNLILINDNYKNLENIIKQYNIHKISGILFDLGFSRYHIEDSGKGFSFQKNEPLIMRYENSKESNGMTAAEIVNTWPEEKLEKILKEYGEEKFFRQIAKKIYEESKKNPIKTTFDLAGIIRNAVPFWYAKRKINPATKTFQALRIAVNDEFENIRTGLSAAVKIIANGGKIAVITFHSGEDRIVKNFLKEKQTEKILKIINKKVIKPSYTEIRENLSARSAKLRTAVRI